MFAHVLNLYMSAAYGHCWRQDAEPDGRSAALLYLSAIVQVLPRYCNPHYLRPWRFCLTCVIFLVPNLVLVFPDLFQVTLLVVSGAGFVVIGTGLLKQKFRGHSSYFFSTPQSIIVKMAASFFASICSFYGCKFPNTLKRTTDFLVVIHTTLCYISLKISLKLIFSRQVCLSFQAKLI